MRKTVMLLGLVLMISGCAGSKRNAAASLPLAAPAGTPEAAATAVDEGNKLFAQGRWVEARSRYEAAIKVEPALAEAHYDLALALERLGRQEEATAHYKEAATLAPGNKVIWNAPPFRHVDAEVQDSRLRKRMPVVDPQRPY